MSIGITSTLPSIALLRTIRKLAGGNTEAELVAIGQRRCAGNDEKGRACLGEPFRQHFQLSGLGPLTQHVAGAHHVAGVGVDAAGEQLAQVLLDAADFLGDDQPAADGVVELILNDEAAADADALASEVVDGGEGKAAVAVHEQAALAEMYRAGE